MELDEVIEDLNGDPLRRRSYYEYPALYDFFHSRVLDREAQVALLEEFRPESTSRVLELGCGTGPLLARIEDEYDEVLGVDRDDGMLERARERTSAAELRRADVTEWSAADEDRTFDATVVFGGLLHLTEDGDVAALAENARAGLRAGGVFVSFFTPLDDVENGSEERRTVESDRYVVERRATTAVTSPDGHYTTVYLFAVTDDREGREATMGTVVRGRHHDADALRETFSDAGFGTVEVLERGGRSVLRAVR